MNIFVLDNDPQTAAIYHTDKHVVKMILESAQIMSTNLRLFDINIGYKITHINHPCTVWARQSLSNWLWLGSLAYYLNEEYKYRFNHTENHKSFDIILTLPWPICIPNIGLTPFAQAMPEEYRDEYNAVKAYRNYYINEKNNLFKWSKRPIPNWIISQ